MRFAVVRGQLDVVLRSVRAALEKRLVSSHVASSLLADVMRLGHQLSAQLGKDSSHVFTGLGARLVHAHSFLSGESLNLSRVKIFLWKVHLVQEEEFFAVSVGVVFDFWQPVSFDIVE